MRDTTQVAANASTEIAASVEEMAFGLRMQMQRQIQDQKTLQLATAIEEMLQTFMEVAGKSSDASLAFEDSQHLGEQGCQIVSNTVSMIQYIEVDVKESSSTMNEPGNCLQMIIEIIGVIHDIADRTNLLALNAVIEATFVGKHGRFFDIVIDKVRKLAERTQQATEEVSQSIRGIQNEMQVEVPLIDSSKRCVSKAVELTTEAGSSLGSIVRTAQSVQSMVQAIDVAANQQSAASGKIVPVVEGINTMPRKSSQDASREAQAGHHLGAPVREIELARVAVVSFVSFFGRHLLDLSLRRVRLPV